MLLVWRGGMRHVISTHGNYEFSCAATFKPSYLVIEVSLDNLHRRSGILYGHFPLIVISGINKANIDSFLQLGVGSIAAASAITKAECKVEYKAESTALLTRIVDNAC